MQCVEWLPWRTRAAVVLAGLAVLWSPSFKMHSQGQGDESTPSTVSGSLNALSSLAST